MLLLVGLGNPGPKDINNRHNIGFKIIDAVNTYFKLSKQKPKFKGLLTTGNIGDVLLVMVIKWTLLLLVHTVSSQMTMLLT